MYNEIKSGLERQGRRRKYYQDMLAKMPSLGDTQMVSGRAVPLNPIQGFSKIAQAMMAKQGMNAADEKEKELNQQMEQGRQDAFARVVEQYTGRPEQFPVDEMGNEMMGAPEAAIEANPVQASMMAMQDPYLQDSGMGKALLSGAKGSDYKTPFVGQDGIAYTFDHRSGKYARANIDGLIAGKLDPVTKGNIAGAQQQAEKDVDKVMNPQIATAETEAAHALELKYSKPQAKISLENAFAQNKNVDKHIDTALANSSVWTTGFIGQITSFVGGTPQHDLGQTLNTIKSSIGLEALQALRSAGGTLGQVTEAEHKLLQDKWTTLSQSQGQEQFEGNLKELKAMIKGSWQRVSLAYELTYGEKYNVQTSEGNPETVEVDTSFSETEEEEYQAWKASQ